MKKTIEYSLALSALIYKNGIQKFVVTAAYTDSARSKEEAIGLGIELSKKEFPPSEGYYSHQCVTCAIVR